MLLHYLGKLKMQIFCRYSADMKENANKLHFWSSLKLIRPQVLIFLVVKIASPTTAAGDSRVRCTQPVAAKQHGLEPGRLPCLGSHAGTSLQDCIAWHSWPQATPHWHLVEHFTDCHRRSHWRVGATTTSLCQSKGTSFQAIAVTNRLFSEPPTFCRRKFK